MLAVADRGIPVRRGERGAEHLHPRPAVLIQQHGAVLVAEHHVVRDVVTGQPGVGAHVAQQVQHAGIGAGGLQAQRANHDQHRRPVLAEVPGHQRDVIVPVVGDGVDVAVLRGEPACGLHRLAGLLKRGLLPRGGLPVRVDLFEHRAVGGHQPFGDLPMLVFERLQFLAGAFGQRAHPAAEHLRGVIAGPGLRGEHQRGHQRDPLGRAVVVHHRGIGGSRLAGEIGDLRRGHPLPPRPRVPEVLDPTLAL